MAVTVLLDRNALDDACLKHGPFTAKRRGQIVGDRLVLIGEASATSQLGGCR
jgi:hypothetical protein